MYVVAYMRNLHTHTLARARARTHTHKYTRTNSKAHTHSLTYIKIYKQTHTRTHFFAHNGAHTFIKTCTRAQSYYFITNFVQKWNCALELLLWAVWLTFLICKVIRTQGNTFSTKFFWTTCKSSSYCIDDGITQLFTGQQLRCINWSQVRWTI